MWTVNFTLVTEQSVFSEPKVKRWLGNRQTKIDEKIKKKMSDEKTINTIYGEKPNEYYITTAPKNAAFETIFNSII